MSSELMASDFDSDLFPHAKDKAIVDFVQGIAVAQHQVQYAEERGGLVSRLQDALSGKTQRRNLHVQQHLVQGLEGCRQWLGEIGGHMEQHATAIIRLQTLFDRQQQQFETLVDVSVAFKEQLLDLRHETGILRKRLDGLELEVRAGHQLVRLTNKWQAGGLKGLSPLQKTYWLLENLYWGAFGEQMRLHVDSAKYDLAIDELKDVLSIQLQKELPASGGIELEEWMHANGAAIDEAKQNTLQFMGDWSLRQVAPITLWTTQKPFLQSEQAATMREPFAILSRSIVARRMIGEVLQGERI